MKYLLLILIMCSIIFISWKKYENEVPPGTVKVSTDFYFDQAELSNKIWLQYISWNERYFGKDSEIYKRSLPDTTVWKGRYINFQTTYLRGEKYQYYPVVGITKEQAIAFCEWRSDRVNQYIYMRDKKTPLTYDDSLHINYPIKFKYRLPKQKEWYDVSRIAFSMKTIKKSIRNYETLGNFYFEYVDSTLNSPYNIFSFHSNKAGIYNLFGNVAEYVLDSENVMGGSWRHSEYQSKLIEGIKSETHANWIGFRCVCERVRE
jgi:formylglycine-generating enzyme required for sulfatase activity